MVEPATPPHFTATQRQLAAHLRDPQANPPPAGIEPRRLAIYRDLFYNNVEGFLRNFFPVLRSLLADDDWHALARAFFAGHRAQTPYFLEIAEEFLAWLDGGDVPAGAAALPFLRELAHYEWLELAVDVADEALPEQDLDPHGDLLAGVPVPSPLAVLAGYRWPVHRIRADFRPQVPAAEPVWLLVYRTSDDQVRFMEVNAATARLWNLLREAPEATGAELAGRIAQEGGYGDPAAVLAGAAELLGRLRERGILLGTRSR
jgi:hypothetical protein